MRACLLSVGTAEVLSLDSDTGNWMTSQTLMSNSTGEMLYFGSTIVVGTDFAAIAATGKGSSQMKYLFCNIFQPADIFNFSTGRSQGEVQIFSGSVGSWSHTQTLAIYNMDSYTCFGTSLALSPDETLLAVGGYCHTNYDGSVFLYRGSGGSGWNLAGFLFADRSNQNALFGYSVALNNELLFASAYGDGELYSRLFFVLLCNTANVTDNGIGGIVVYNVSGVSSSTGIVELPFVEAIFLANGTSNDWFGSAFVVEGRVMVVAVTGPGRHALSICPNLLFRLMQLCPAYRRQWRHVECVRVR
jgi:hypothetical protein